MDVIKQLNFAGGEITPSLYARVDQSKYQSGLRTCRNMMVMKHGGLENRPGTEFIVEAKDGTKKIRLIPFVFNDDQTYVLEFGDLYIRFIKDDAQLEVASVPVEVTTTYLEADIPDLKFAQSADIITIVHPSYPPMELARLSDTSWTLTAITFESPIVAPTLITIHTIAPFKEAYTATAVDNATGEESYIGNQVVSTTYASSTTPRTVFGNIIGATSDFKVNIYKSSVGGVYGYIGSVSTNGAGQFEFVDDGIDPDYDSNPPEDLVTFDAVDDYPSAVSYSQQRLFLGGTNNNPETMYASKTGLYHNFTRTYPIADDDTLEFNLVGPKVSLIRDIVEVRQPIVLTSGAEWVLGGDSAGAVRPGDINAKHQTFNGSSGLTPVHVDGSILYVQARGSIVRDFIFDFEVDSYRGNDLTIYSSHLVRNKSITEWAYQQNPNSIVWAVRSDGTLLGLTYLREQGILAWHRHDFSGGTVESVTSIPSTTKDSVYVSVKRTIDGVTTRYIEKLSDREYSDIKDAVFTDSTIKYDGRNTNTALPMTLTGGGPNWDHNSTVDLKTLAAYFSSSDVGNTIHMTGADGLKVIGTITTYVSSSWVIIKPDRTIPVSLQGVATLDWAKGVDVLSGLDHLEGEDVSVYGDGYVVHSPNNPNYATKTVASGSVTLDRPYTVIHVGLPITADVETLDIDTDNGETLANKKMIINKITAYVEESRGIFGGSTVPSDDGVSGLREYVGSDSDDYADPPSVKTQNIDLFIKAKWSRNGRILLRQVDPLPMKILAIVPIGEIPFRG